MDMCDEYIALYKELNPLMMEKIGYIKSRNTKFIHYTSAANAISIIRNREVWMRNASEMNDFSEVEHGQRCLSAAWDSDVGERFRTILNQVDKDLADRLAQSFNERVDDRERASFIISVSEHGSAIVDEDKYGRLSMWRAYGGDTNVGLVMNNAPFLNEVSNSNVFTLPVFYGDPQSFVNKFKHTVDAFENNIELSRRLGADCIHSLFESMFHFTALSTKHPGFSEEREWRVILSPTMFLADRIPYNVEIVHGVPQVVYKFPFQDCLADGIVGVEIPALLEEIIIGPTESVNVIGDALRLTLEDAGVQDASNRIKVSNIPLRR